MERAPAPSFGVPARLDYKAPKTASKKRAFPSDPEVREFLLKRTQEFYKPDLTSVFVQEEMMKFLTNLVSVNYKDLRDVTKEALRWYVTSTCCDMKLENNNQLNMELFATDIAFTLSQYETEERYILILGGIGKLLEKHKVPTYITIPKRFFQDDILDAEDGDAEMSDSSQESTIKDFEDLNLNEDTLHTEGPRKRQRIPQKDWL